MFAKKLKSLRKSREGLTQEKLADVLGVTQQAVGRWEKGLNMPDNDIQVKLADYFHVSLDFLQGREDIGLYKLRETKRVPVIGTVKCGVGGLAYEYIDEYIAIDDKFRADEMRGFRVEGDSMEPEIHAGDICLVHLQEDAPNGALVVAIILDSEECQGTIKRIHKSDGGFFLQPTNPAYSPIPFFGERVNKVRIVGQVVEVRHKTI